VAARLLSYRRVDVAVQAAKRLGRDLVVAGAGPESNRLRRLAGPRTRFTGYVRRPELVRLVQRCHAYLVPGVEDFGIAPVEAMASGKPVVALAAGGALETVADGRSGILVATESVEAFTDAIDALDRVTWDPAEIRASALRFARPVFEARWRTLLERLGLGDLLEVRQASGPSLAAAEAAAPAR
jgi:glycosyltransferase involved in cell wall biosynthesis